MEKFQKWVEADFVSTLPLKKKILSLVVKNYMKTDIK